MENLIILLDNWNIVQDDNHDLYRHILDTSHDNFDDSIQIEVLSLQKLTSNQLLECLNILNSVKSQDILNAKSIASIIALTATSLVSIYSYKDFKDCIIGCRLLISILSLPGAPAYGLINSHILNTISSYIHKAMALEFQLKPQQTDVNHKVRNAGKQSQNASSQRSTTRNKSLQKETCDDSEDEESDSVMMSSDDTTVRDRRNTVVGRVSPQQLHLFLEELQKSINIFISRNEESSMELLVDSLSSVLYICALRSEFKNSQLLLSEILVAIGYSSFSSFARIVRSLMPAVAFHGRDNRLPEGGKLRNLCHKASIGIILQMISKFHEYSLKPAFKDWNFNFSRQAVEHAEDTDACIAETNEDQTTYESSSENCFLNCIVGIIQRMTINSPDRAPIKQAILSSLHQILHGVISNQNTWLESDKLNQIIKSYLSFLVKLCKSNKLSYRSFAVDIISSILLPSTASSSPMNGFAVDYNDCDNVDSLYFWIWSDINNDVDADTLLFILLKRCSDVAPSVRLRALSSVCDILSSLNETTPKKLSSTVLQFALGVVITAEPNANLISSDSEVEDRRVSLNLNDMSSVTNSNYFNLLDILRARTNDKKPLVRSKALLAYGLAMSIQWPRYTTIYLESMPEESQQIEQSKESISYDEITMLLSEEDLDIFMKACHDISFISIRKQGLLSLSQLMVVRPLDLSLQEAWINAVLSLVIDSEVSVIQKVITVVNEVIFEKLISWSKSTTTSNADNNMAYSLVWSLCNRIAALHRESLLRSCVSAMIKQGMITQTNIKSFFNAVWIACTWKIDSKTSKVASQLNDPESNATEEIHRAGWILLESIINQSLPNTTTSSVSESITTTTILQKDEFKFSEAIVASYQSKVCSMSSLESLNHRSLDDDIIRILQILQHLSCTIGSLSSSQIHFLKQEMDKIINSFILHPALISVSIMVRYSLSSQISQDLKSNLTQSTYNTDLISSETHAGIMHWCKPLLEQVYFILYSIVWDRPPKTSNRVNVPQEIQHALNSKESGSITNIANFALFILGELIMLGFTSDEDENGFYTPSFNSYDKIEYMVSKFSNKLFKLRISDEMIQLIQLMMGHSFPSRGVKIPNEVRAYAFVAMGKLCLRSQQLAREHINVYLREIQTSISVNGVKNNTNALNKSIESTYVVKNNALLVLNDFCIRYTNLIEHHIDLIADCGLSFYPLVALESLGSTGKDLGSLLDHAPMGLRQAITNGSSMLRRHTLIILSQLILQDYIKCRPNILYRIMSCLLDTSVELQELTKIVLSKILSLKFPDFLSSKFSEAILIYNDCYDHPLLIASNVVNNTGSGLEEVDSVMKLINIASGNAVNASNNEILDSSDTGESSTTYDSKCQTKFHLSGAENRSKRMKLFDFMMEGLSEEQRIQVTAKLVQDILSNAVDRHFSSSRIGNSSSSTILSISPNEFQVLEDTFIILQSPMLKIGKTTLAAASTANTTALDEEDLSNIPGSQCAGISAADSTSGTAVSSKENAINKAKSKVLRVLSKQHMMNHILPVVMSLKHTLESMRSPLQGPLMDYLRYLMTQHKTEVAEVLSSDPILKAELEYDLKNHERLNDRQKDQIQADVDEAIQTTDRLISIHQSGNKRYSLGSSSKSQVLSANKELIKSAKKASSTSRRLSIRFKDMESDSQELADRLTSYSGLDTVDESDGNAIEFNDNQLSNNVAVDVNIEQNVDRLKKMRWSISMPQFESDLNKPEIDTLTYSNKIVNIDDKENSINTALKDVQEEKVKKETKINKKRSIRRDKVEDINVVEDKLIYSSLLSPEKKKSNHQTTPDITLAKSKARKQK